MSFSSLKKRLIFKIGIGYLALTWLIVQIIATLTPIYDLPGILVQGIAFMLLMSYPFVMLMGWAYEITHKTRGRGWEKIDRESSIHKEPTGRFYIFITGVVVLSLVILLVDIFILRR